MSEQILESVETQEVAEPDTDESVETQEVAEPEEDTSTKTDTDKAFAEIRRRAEEAERRALEAEERSRQFEETLGLWFQGEDKVAEAMAYAQGITPEEAREQMEEAQYFASLEEENERLRNQVLDVQVDKAMNEGLAEIQAIDPTVKDLTELGESFPNYILAGLTSAQAYYAVKAEQKALEAVAPKPIGKVDMQKAESEFYTRDEVEAMSQEEVKKNFEKIRKSMTKWSN